VALVSIWDPFGGDFGIHLGSLRCNFGEGEDEEEEEEDEEEDEDEIRGGVFRGGFPWGPGIRIILGDRPRHT